MYPVTQLPFVFPVLCIRAVLQSHRHANDIVYYVAVGLAWLHLRRHVQPHASVVPDFAMVAHSECRETVRVRHYARRGK